MQRLLPHITNPHARGSRRRRRSRLLPGLALLALACPPGAWAGGGAPPAADFGDAPDGQNAGYPPPFAGVIGNFPTLFATTNSRYGLPGAHTLVTGDEWLGPVVSAEIGAYNLSRKTLTVANVVYLGFERQ